MKHSAARKWFQARRHFFGFVEHLPKTVVPPSTLWGGEFWVDGYYVATVGERADWGVVERYVKNQGKSKEELRQLTLF